MSSEVKFEIQVRAVMRQGYSKPAPETIIKGAAPIIVITFPNINERNENVMIVDVDSTSFEPIELAALLRSVSDTLLDGVKMGEEVTSATAPEDFDWSVFTKE